MRLSEVLATAHLRAYLAVRKDTSAFTMYAYRPSVRLRPAFISCALLLRLRGTWAYVRNPTVGS